jgi:hypothetical protein
VSERENMRGCRWVCVPTKGVEILLVLLSQYCRRLLNGSKETVEREDCKEAVERGVCRSFLTVPPARRGPTPPIFTPRTLREKRHRVQMCLQYLDGIYSVNW